MNTPQVSIIIPSFNYGRFIEHALRSALTQTFRDFEVIVVDDGSTDDTMQRVRAFGPSVHYVHQANSGAAAARNTGVLRSRGEFIAFLDADDVWLPTKLTRQVEVLRSADAGVAYTWWSFIDGHGRPLPQVKAPTFAGDVLGELLRGCFVTFSMLMVRRSCFDRIGLLDTSLPIAEDWDLLLRLAAAGYQFAYVPEVLVKNRLHEAPLSADHATKSACERVVLTKALARLPDSPELRLARKEALRVLLVSSAVENFKTGDEKRAIALLTELAEHQPDCFDRPSLYLGMAYKFAPYGLRETEAMASHLDAIEAALVGLVGRLFEGRDLPGAVARRRRTAWSSLMLALAVLNGRSRRWPRSASFVGRAFLSQPTNPGAAALERVRQRLGSRAAGDL